MKEIVTILSVLPLLIALESFLAGVCYLFFKGPCWSALYWLSACGVTFAVILGSR